MSPLNVGVSGLVVLIAIRYGPIDLTALHGLVVLIAIR